LCIFTRKKTLVVVFMTRDGDMVAIATILPSQARAFTGQDITCAGLVETL
jgi:hypothetical protein